MKSPKNLTQSTKCMRRNSKDDNLAQFTNKVLRVTSAFKRKCIFAKTTWRSEKEASEEDKNDEEDVWKRLWIV